MKPNSMQQQFEDMRRELREEFRKLGVEVSEIKGTSVKNNDNLMTLAADVKPIIDIYQTWSKIGKWSKPVLFSISLIVAIIAGVLQIWRKVP